MNYSSNQSTNAYRSILGLGLTVSFASEYGLSPKECLRGTGLQAQDLNDPAAMVTIEQEISVIRNLMAKTNTPGLGALLGTRFHATAFGALGLALTSSASGLEALEVALRFFSLTFALTRFTAQQVGELTLVTIDDAHIPKEVRRFIVERDAACLVTVQKDLFFTIDALRQLDFTFTAPQTSLTHQRIYGVTPRYGMPANVISLSTEQIQKPLPQANAFTFKAAIKQCEQTLAKLQAPVDTASQVRLMLQQNPTEWSDMEKVAQHFCITSRTLRRRLNEAGVTFIALRDEIRLKLAESFLIETTLSVEEIAANLNYANATSFINAFKRWKGQTPLIYKRKLLKNLDV